MGYHRLHTHRGYKCSQSLRVFHCYLRNARLEGGPIFWVGTHRIHHQLFGQGRRSAQPARWRLVGTHSVDGHGRGLSQQDRTDGALCSRSGRDPFYRWLNTYHWVPLTVLGFILLRLAAFRLVLWGIFLRVTLGHHATWLVNSATHMWGSRRFNIRDDSRNNWWVALLTFGEGWHNNHHAHPTSARHGLAWYELDITWLQLKALETIGVIRNLKVAKVTSLTPAESKLPK